MASFVDQHYAEALAKYFNSLDDYEYEGIGAGDWNATNAAWAATKVAGSVQAHLVKYGRRPDITNKLFAEEGFEEGYLEGLAEYFNSLDDYTFKFEDGTVVVPGEWTADLAKAAAEEVSGSVEEHFLLYARRPAILNKVDEVEDPESGQTFTLTDAVGENVVGTEGNDTFRGVVDTTVTSTVNTGDTIDGKAGNDRLDILAESGAGLPTGFETTNVENIFITNNSLTTVNTNVFDGAEQLWFVDNGNSVTVSNLDADITLGMKGDAAAAVTGDFGTSSSANLALDAAENTSGGNPVLNGTAVRTLNVSGLSLIHI